MAYIQTRQASIGELISGTFSNIAGVKKEIAIYCGAFFLAGLAADLLGDLGGLIGLAAFAGYFAGQYYLYRAMLSRAGVIYDPAFKAFSMFLMALILIIPISFGLNFFFIPGILLAAKWIMAPTYLVAEEINLFDAIGQSWRASSGNTLPLSLTFTLICFIWFAILGVGGSFLGSLGDLAGAGRAGPNALDWVLVHALPIMLMGLSVTAYRVLGDDENSYVAVFE